MKKPEPLDPLLERLRAAVTALYDELYVYVTDDDHFDWDTLAAHRKAIASDEERDDKEAWWNE